MPAKKTRAKKAQAKKKPSRKTQAKEILSPDTPPADGRSPFTQLPLEIHMVIGDMLKEDKRLGALATLARTSRRICSFYEQQLYKGKGNTHNIDALMWGARHNSVAVMKSARQWGADLNVRSRHPDTHGFEYRNIEGTALQVAVRDGHIDCMRWLLDEGALMDIPETPAYGMCPCTSSYPLHRSSASSLHLAFCNENLSAAKTLLRREPAASVRYSRQVDTRSILNTAVAAALYTRSTGFLDVALENPSIRKSINGFQGEDNRTALAVALDIHHDSDHLLDSILFTLVMAGASLGPYPQGSYMAGRSPLMCLLERGQRKSATYLLRFGCDPNGDRPHPITPGWRSPLHFYINPEHHDRLSIPGWQQRAINRWELQRRPSIRDFIVILLKHGASLDITDFEGKSPLDNAVSFMARYVAPKRRVAGFKLVKFLLAKVKAEGISKESRERAEDVMATLVQDLRAEHATHNLSDARVRGWDWGEDESEPIRLGWHAWRREGGRLRRK